MGIQGIQVKCPHCNNVWNYKGTAVKATCTSCYHKVQVRSLPDPAPGPRKAPAGVKKILAKKKAQPEPVGPAISQAIEKAQASDVQTLQGKTQTITAGRRIKVETIVTPAPVPVKYPRQPFSPMELLSGHICHHCHRKIRPPKMGFWLDGHKIPIHRVCLVDRAIQESDGDLQRACLEWDIPLEALVKRSAVLKEKGKLNFESNLT